MSQDPVQTNIDEIKMATILVELGIDLSGSGYEDLVSQGALLQDTLQEQEQEKPCQRQEN